MDGWKNFITGLNVMGKDKKMSSHIEWQRRTEDELDALVGGDAMARKIVERPVQDAFREGWKLIGLDQKIIDKLEEKALALDLKTVLQEASIKARQYGGAGILFAGGVLNEERRPKEKITSLLSLSKFELYPDYSGIQRDITQKNFGRPTVYKFWSAGSVGQNGAEIDQSHIIRFDGLWLPRKLWIMNQYWGDSVLNAIEAAIRDYASTNDSMATIVQDFSTAVYKLKGLADKIGSDGEADLLKRMSYMNLCQSAARATVIDSEGEEFSHQSRNVAGIKDVADNVKDALVALTDFPHTILFGTSPAGGLNGSGGHELTNWYDWVSAYQENYLKMKILQAYKLIAAEENIDVTKMDLEFFPLYQLTEKEEADVKKTVADTDAIYMDRGVFTPEQIAKSRYGSGKYSSDMDMEATEEAENISNAVDPDLENPNPATPPAETSIQAAALNGAQIASLLQITDKVAMNTLPKPAAKAVIQASFPTLLESQINQILDPIVPGSMSAEGGAPKFNQDSETVDEVLLGLESEAEDEGDQPDDEHMDMYSDDQPRAEDGKFGEGSGSGGGKAKGGDTGSKLTAATAKVKASSDRREKATNALKAMHGKVDPMSPEFAVAAKEYKSAVRANNKAMREGRSLVKEARAERAKS